MAAPPPITPAQRVLVDRIAQAIADGMRTAIRREVHVGKQGRYDDEDVMKRSAPIRAIEVQFEGSIQDCMVILANLRPDQAIEAVAGASAELVRQFNALSTATAFPPLLHEIPEHEDAVELLEALHLEPTVQLNAELGGDFLVILGSGLLTSLEAIVPAAAGVSALIGSSPTAGHASSGAIPSGDIDALTETIQIHESPEVVSAVAATPVLPKAAEDAPATMSYSKPESLDTSTQMAAAVASGPTYADDPAAIEAAAEAILAGGIAPPLAGSTDPRLVVQTDLDGISDGSPTGAFGIDAVAPAPEGTEVAPGSHSRPVVPSAPAASGMGADLGSLADAMLHGDAASAAGRNVPQAPAASAASHAAAAHANAAAATSHPLQQRWGALLSGVEVEISAELGRTVMCLGDVTSLDDDKVITLDENIEDPVTVYVNGALYATARLVEVDGQYGIEILEVLEPELV